MSIIFIILKLDSFDLDIMEYMKINNIKGTVLAIILLMLSTWSLSLGWRNILEQLTSKKISKKEVEKIYIKTNLSKYIPGNVMQFVGRNLLAKEYNIPQDTITLSTVYEIGLLGLIGGSIILLSGQINVIMSFISSRYIILVIVLASVGIIAGYIVLRSNHTISKYIKKLNYEIIIRCIKRAVIYYLTGLLLMGASFVIILYTFYKNEIKLSNLLLFIGAFIVAWFIGFITPGVPGGIGIREAVLMVYLGNLFTDTHIIEIVAIHRVITIFSDIIMYLLCLLKGKRRNTYEV